MISLPGGYNGLYIKIDHRLMDSCGAIVMVNDIMELYCHYKFGTPYPEDMASFTDMVERDLKKAQTKNVSQKTACTGKMCWRKMENLFTPIYRDNGYFRKADAFTMTSHSALQIRRSTTCLSLQRTITWMLSQLRIFWIFV